MNIRCRRAFSGLALAATVLLSACAGVPAQFAPSTVTDRSQVDLSQGRKVTATSSGMQLLFFIPIGVNSRHSVAYKELVKEAGDGLLADVTVTEGWRYAFVGTVYTTTIEATVYPRVGSARK